MSSRRSDKKGSSSHPGVAVSDRPAAEAWRPATLIAFRFGVVYLVLFALVTQISGSMLPNLTFYYRGLGRLWPVRDATVWLTQHLFGATAGLEDPGAGGEPLIFWVQTLCVLVVAIAATAIWSSVDRRREYARLHAWFRVFVRLALASAMFEYGMTKVIPTQFPAPSLETLVTPVGDLTLSALLWTSIGAAPAYEIFTGCVETLGAILLLVPRTAMLGALVSLGALTQVFALNMTYDIGLKVVSFHLIVLALVLLAPVLPRLVDFFVRLRPSHAPREPQLARTRRGNRIALMAQLAFGAYLLLMYSYINVTFWNVGGGSKPRSPLYGVWNVEQLSVDGDTRPPSLNEYDRRWRRIIFESPDTVLFQRTDDSFARYGLSLDSAAHTFALSKGGSRVWHAPFLFERPSPDRLILQGTMDGHRIEARLARVEFDTFRLLNSRFRWVRPHD